MFDLERKTILVATEGSLGFPSRAGDERSGLGRVIGDGHAMLSEAQKLVVGFVGLERVTESGFKDRGERVKASKVSFGIGDLTSDNGGKELGGRSLQRGEGIADLVLVVFKGVRITVECGLNLRQVLDVSGAIGVATEGVSQGGRGTASATVGKVVEDLLGLDMIFLEGLLCLGKSMDGFGEGMIIATVLGRGSKLIDLLLHTVHGLEVRHHVDDNLAGINIRVLSLLRKAVETKERLLLLVAHCGWWSG